MNFIKKIEGDCIVRGMCGRFSLTETVDSLEDRFSAEMDSEWSPSYNIAPSMVLPTIILNEDPTMFQELTWGIRPKWLAPNARGLINVRAESIAEKVTFKKSFEEKRCLIPATGFYEWKKEGEKKQPYYFKLKEEPVFSFAGLWSEDKDADGKTLRTFAIITTEANEIMADVHNRMPVILNKENEEEWLSLDNEGAAVSYLLTPFESSLMAKVPVSTLVNNPRNNNAGLINSL